MRPQGNCGEDGTLARGFFVLHAKHCAGCNGDDAYWAATHLKAGFGGVRLGSLDLRIALSSCLATCLSCASC